MENSETKKQFQISLYEDEILITTPSNKKDAFRAKINYPNGKRMLIFDKYGMQHYWIETGDSDLNYLECCGVLILFGIKPPSFWDLHCLLA